MRRRGYFSAILVLFLGLSYAVWYFLIKKESMCHIDSTTGIRTTISVRWFEKSEHLDHGDFSGTCEEARTYVPDDAFEAYLIYSGYDDIMDDYVLTSNINTVDSIYLEDADEYRYGLPYFQLRDLTGLEDFTGLEFFHLDINHLVFGHFDFSNNIALETLELDGSKFSSIDLSNNIVLKNVRLDGNRFITSLDLSQNPDLERIWVASSAITRLNLKNGNNVNVSRIYLDLDIETCIQVDNAIWSTANWPTENTYSESCF